MALYNSFLIFEIFTVGFFFFLKSNFLCIELKQKENVV